MHSQIRKISSWLSIKRFNIIIYSINCSVRLFDIAKHIQKDISLPRGIGILRGKYWEYFC
jgi:hypothetical protein